MRLWSIHPKYLDSKGLGGLWREGLGAVRCLYEPGIGYSNHAQLNRFKAEPDYLAQIGSYMHEVADEADRRGYNYDRTLLPVDFYKPEPMTVTVGQIAYEFRFLLGKLKTRDKELFEKFQHTTTIELHPRFTPIPGPIADWERVKVLQV